jgi:hypothetical protein
MNTVLRSVPEFGRTLSVSNKVKSALNSSLNLHLVNDVDIRQELLNRLTRGFPADTVYDVVSRVRSVSRSREPERMRALNESLISALTISLERG